MKNMELHQPDKRINFVIPSHDASLVDRNALGIRLFNLDY